MNQQPLTRQINLSLFLTIFFIMACVWKAASIRLNPFHSGHAKVIQTLSISCLLMTLLLWSPSHPLVYHLLILACLFILGADALFRFNIEEWLWCTHIFTYFYNHHTACNELNLKYNCHIYIFQQTIHHNYVASCQCQSRIICPNSS